MTKERAITKERADKAESAIAAYAGEDFDDLNNAMIRLLTDLRHYCAMSGLRFDQAASTAREDYYRETFGPVSRGESLK